MHKQRTIVILALLLAIQPFLGFPISWKYVFVGVGGLLIAFIAIFDSIIEYFQTASAEGGKTRSANKKRTGRPTLVAKSEAEPIDSPPVKVQTSTPQLKTPVYKFPLEMEAERDKTKVG